MTVDEMIQHLNSMTMDGDLYESLVSALRAAEQLHKSLITCYFGGRIHAPESLMDKVLESIEAFDAATKGGEG